MYAALGGSLRLNNAGIRQGNILLQKYPATNLNTLAVINKDNFNPSRQIRNICGVIDHT